MQNNNPNDYFQEHAIDLNEVIRFLIDSKKLIISITLVITTLGAIYAFQKEPVYESTALMEIGEYKLDKSTALIEPTEDLIKELNINFVLKQQVNMSFKSLEDRLISLNTRSNNPEMNIDLLNKIIGYIENRHSKLMQKTVNQLTSKIERLNELIKFNNNALLTQNEDKKLRITSNIESLNKKIEYEKLKITSNIERSLPSIDLKIKELNSIILQDEANLLLLETDPDLFIQRAAQSPTLNQVIYSYKNQILDLQVEKIQLSQYKDTLESEAIFKLSMELENLKSEFDKLESNISEQEKDSMQIELKFGESNNPESEQSFKLSPEEDFSEEIFRLSQERDRLQIELKLLESINPESEKSFRLSQEKDSLELELEFLMKQNQTSTQLVGKIVTNKIATKKVLYILLSLMLGLVLGIFIVFINNSLKAFKKQYV